MEMHTSKARRKAEDLSLGSILSDNLKDALFPPHLVLVPQLNEVYELELAYYEAKILSDDEILRNGAYFASVDGKPTRHFLICQGEPLKLAEHSSSRLKSFFKNNQFKTGYGTHGLFPYRGKFHPQMIKGLINVMGLKPGMTVLDPMMGSGTVPLEATLMGINSVGIDSSPFCEFMARAKIEGLRVPLKPIKTAMDHFDSTFKYLNSKVDRIEGSFQDKQASLFDRKPQQGRARANPSEVYHQPEVDDYLLLAFLDAKGYAERSNRKSFPDQFKAILERYYFVADKIQNVMNGLQEQLGNARVFTGDARSMDIPSQTIDGIIFSPPYSFAIDYVKNDEHHLKFMGVDIDKLRESMIGLRGRNLKEKYETYVEDMTKVLSECSRVLKFGGICSVVVGTNNNQLSSIFQVEPEEVTGIHETLIEGGSKHGLRLVRKIERQITGMANTMRSEFIVMLQKG
jgi:hypothetical protein